jgi:hypothetical protein
MRSTRWPDHGKLELPQVQSFQYGMSCPSSAMYRCSSNIAAIPARSSGDPTVFNRNFSREGFQVGNLRLSGHLPMVKPRRAVSVPQPR